MLGTELYALSITHIPNLNKIIREMDDILKINMTRYNKKTSILDLHNLAAEYEFIKLLRIPSKLGITFN